MTNLGEVIFQALQKEVKKKMSEASDEKTKKLVEEEKASLKDDLLLWEQILEELESGV